MSRAACLCRACPSGKYHRASIKQEALAYKLERLQKLEKLKDVESQRVVGAFVTFQHSESALRCRADYHYTFSRVFQPPPLRFRGTHALQVRRAPPPTDVLWENIETTRCEKVARRFMTTFLLLVRWSALACGVASFFCCFFVAFCFLFRFVCVFVLFLYCAPVSVQCSHSHALFGPCFLSVSVCVVSACGWAFHLCPLQLLLVCSFMVMLAARRSKAKVNELLPRLEMCDVEAPALAWGSYDFPAPAELRRVRPSVCRVSVACVCPHYLLAVWLCCVCECMCVCVCVVGCFFLRVLLLLYDKRGRCCCCVTNEVVVAARHVSVV
mgnify:CR=1 FL=1